MGSLELIIQLAYLLSAVLFIMGLKKLSSPATARRGNMLSAAAMLIAIVVTLLDESILSFEWIVVGLIIGTLIGTAMARLVKMTDMPQMVAVFNGLGGLASGADGGRVQRVRWAGIRLGSSSRIPALPDGLDPDP